MDPVPRRRTCGLCAQPNHDRRHCRAADLYRAAHPEVTDANVHLHIPAIRAFAAAGLPPVPPPPPRTRCIMNQEHAHWGDRFQCRTMAPPGHQYCTRCDSIRPRLDLPREQRCSVARCTCIIADRGLCKRHLAGEVIRRRRLYLDTAWTTAIDQMERDPASWPQIVQGWAEHVPDAQLGATAGAAGAAGWWRGQVRHMRPRLAGQYFIRDLWNQDNPHDPMDENGVIDWHLNRVRAGTVRPPAGTLAAFAADTQNVHTGVVSNQTHEGVKKLLAVPVPSGQADRTKAFVARLLKDCMVAKMVTQQVATRIYADFDHWYKVSTCRAQADWLYKRVFDGLILTIAANPNGGVKIELFKRLFEEMKDSLGMCCDGHITRLINVLAGFDEAFAPEKSVGEKTQELFAALAGKECALLEKVAEGCLNLRKWGVPEDEWEPWIDAL